MRVAVTFSNPARLSPYLTALDDVSIGAVRNPPSIEALDGLLLTGGSDINPKRYGRNNTGSNEVDDARDELELHLLQEALAAGVPVFAICRGLQLFNVARGGTLIQNLASTDVHRQPSGGAEAGKHAAAHRVWVAPETRLAGIVGAGGLDVNSRHHQAVESLGQGLTVSAISEDGVIEAIELPGAAFAVAVQWHPEDRILVSEADRKLFAAFAAAIATSPAGRHAAPQPSW